MEKVTEIMLVSDILEVDADIAEVFKRNGLNCVGCPGSYSESLREAAKGHGIQLDKLIDDLNKYLSNK
jgi:hybrid cluster-associated redox disulfide protein